MSFVIVNKNKNDIHTQQTRKRNKHEFFNYNIKKDTSFETKILSSEQYKSVPPLRPERFRRRVKMLWGIDINEYPDNSVIILGGYAPAYYCFSLDKDYQLLRSATEPDEPSIISPAHSDSMYSVFRKYLFFNDLPAKEDLLKYKEESLSALSSKYDTSALDWMITELCHDFIQLGYFSALFDVRNGLLKDVDTGVWGLFNSDLSNFQAQIRTTDLRFDVIKLYCERELEEGENFANGPSSNEDQIWLGFTLGKSELNEGGYTPKNFLSRLVDPQEFYPWHNYIMEKGVSAYLSFLLQLKKKELNKFVIQYISGQADPYLGNNLKHQEIRLNIKSNKYYGYSVLREFCENPMREMPILENIGTNFKGKVKGKEAVLLLEPFADSYDIDTIQRSETFTAYEMGHDDYYFIEVEKPVESPVAGPDGYAMIVDRKETVYGYLQKTDVEEYADKELLSTPAYTNLSKSKQGVIEDPDGYVNISKDQDAQSEILGKILDKEVFYYWKVPDSDWYIIQTGTNIRGFVHKSRIKEKQNVNNWILDE